jgi:hypothetical protein
MKGIDDFASFYGSTLHGKLKGLETRRKNMKEMRWRTVSVALSVIFIHWALIYFEVLPGITWVVSLIGAPPASYYYYKRFFFDASIASEFKDTAVRQIVSFADPSLTYAPEGFVPYEEFRASQLYMTTPDHYTGDDLIQGKIDGRNAVLSELLVQIEDKRMTKHDKSDWITLFKGLFISIELEKPFPFKTFIFSDNLQAKLGYTGRLIQEGECLYGQYVHILNQEFEDRFVMYSEEPVKAQRMMKPEFIEEIMQLEDNSGGKVRIAMLESKLFVAIEMQKDFFAINLERSLLDLSYLSTFYKDLYYVSKMVSDLDIDALTA